MWTGISIASGNVNIGAPGLPGENVIGSKTATFGIFASTSTGRTSVVGIYATSTGTVNIQNTQIGGIESRVMNAAQCGGLFVGIETAGAGGAFNISNNSIGNTLANNIRCGNSGNQAINQALQSSGSGLALPVLGIRHNATGATVISSNTLRGWQIGANNYSGAGITAIISTGNVTNSIAVDNNLIGTPALGWLNWPFAFTGNSPITGISITGNGGATSHSIQGNDFRGIVNTITGSVPAFPHTYINLSGATAANNVTTISDNTFTNLSVNTTGNVTFISCGYLVSTTGTQTVNNNRIITGFSKTSLPGNAGGGTITGLVTNSGATAGAVCTHTNNNFSNITTVGTTAITGIAVVGGQVSRTVTGNTLSNWTTGTGFIQGIFYNGFGGSSSVSNNILSNFNTNGAITAFNLGAGGSTANPLLVSGNIINTLTSANTGGAVTALTVGNGSPTISIIGNIINAVSSVGASSAVTGLSIVGGANITVSKNKIYDLFSSGATPLVSGILVSSGTNVALVNNLIGDLRAPNGNNGFTDIIRGINITSTVASSTINVLHNTVHLNATAIGNLTTSCLFHTASTTATTASLNLRNNILYNVSTTTAGCMALAYRRSSGNANELNNYASTSDNNFFYAGTGINRFIFGNSQNAATTIEAYRNGVFIAGTIAPRDASSASDVITFQSILGSSPDFLKYSTTIPLAAESRGILGLVADDFAGTTRCPSGACPGGASILGPDMGAWELNGLLTPPTITYLPTPIANQPTVANVVLTGPTGVNVTNSAPHGVNTTSGTRPRIYFKKLFNANVIPATNTNTTNGWKWVEASNTTSPFDFTIDYSLLNSGVAPGTVIQYFFVAQDLAGAPNVAISDSLAFLALPSSVNLTTAQLPAANSMKSYTIQIQGGTVTVGTTGDVPTLTGQGGLFAALNVSTVTSPVTAEIVSNIAEPGTNSLVSYVGGANSLTIQPTAGVVTYTLSGNITSATNAALINFVACNNVTVDGTNGSSTKRLTFINGLNSGSNAATVPTIQFTHNAAGNVSSTNCAIQNCKIQSNSSSTDYGVVHVANTTGVSLFTNLVFSNNEVSGVLGGVQSSAGMGISVGNLIPNLVRVTGLQIIDNAVFDVSSHGILANIGLATQSATITGNKVFSIASAAPVYNYNTSSFTGIDLRGGSGHTLSNNQIGGSTTIGSGYVAPTNAGGAAWNFTSPTVAVSGINLSSNTNSKATVDGNLVRNINLSGVGASSFTGIGTPVSSSTLADFTNNVIGDSTLTNSITHAGTGSVNGIYLNSGAAGAFSMSNNEVGGISSASTQTAIGSNSGIYCNPGISATVGVQGNTIKNIALTTSGNASIFGLCFENGVNNIGTVTPNRIRNIANSGTSISTPCYTIGVYAAGTSGSIRNNSVWNVSGTGTGTNVSVSGIWNATASGNYLIRNNQVLEISTSSTSPTTTDSLAPPVALTGIRTSSTAASQIIELNTLTGINYSSTSVGQLYGIFVDAGANQLQVRYNKLFNLTSSSTAAAGSIVGINIAGSGSSAALAQHIHNNMVTILNGVNTNDIIISGIRDAASGGFNNYFFNSVLVSNGAAIASPTKKTYAFVRVADATLILRNKLLVNKRAGAGLNFAIGNINGTPATGWPGTASDNNVLFALNQNNTGEWGTGLSRTIAQWRTSSGGDAASFGNTGVANTTLSAPPVFVDEANGDLRSDVNQNCFLNGTGEFINTPVYPIVINLDLEGTTRPISGGTLPDIGADEFTYVGLTHTIGSNSTICANGTLNLTLTPNVGTLSPTYSWAGTGTFSPNNTTQNPSVSVGLIAGTSNYVATVTDINGCQTTATTSVTVNPIPTLTSVLQPTVCSGNTATINLDGLLPSAVFDLNYTINGVGQPSITGLSSSISGTASFTSTALSLANNGQNLVITDMTRTDNSPNCAFTFVSGNTVVLSVNPNPTLASTTQSGLSCSGQNATINLTGLVSGSTFDLTYTINAGAPITISGIVASGTTASIAVPVNFVNNGQVFEITTMTITSLSPSCTQPIVANNTLVLYVNPLPTAQIVANDFVCELQTAPIAFNLTGTGPWFINYSINGVPQAGFSQPTSPFNTSFSPPVTGIPTSRDYEITALTDNNGCVAIPLGLSSLTIGVPVPCRITWNGSISGDWNTAGNWTPGNSAPSNRTSVLIPGGVPQPNIVTVGPVCASLELTNAAIPVIGLGGELNVRGDLKGTNTSYFTGVGKMVLSGTGIQTVTGTMRIGNVDFANSIGSLTVSPGASLRIEPGAVVTFLANSQLVNNGKFILGSSASGTAKIGVIPTSAIISGELTMERYLPYTSGTGSWYFIGSPFSGKNFTNWSDDFRVVGLSTGFGVQGGGIINSSQPERSTIFKYVEANHNQRIDTAQKIGWTIPGNENIVPGSGYRAYVNYYSNPTHRFNNTGLITRGSGINNEFTFPALSRNEYAGCIPTTFVCNGANWRGWNLLANPFPCDVNWDSETNWTKPGTMSNAWYRWHSSASGYGVYTTGVYAGTTPIPTNPNLIPSGQAFFVRLDAPGIYTASLSVKEAAKVTTSSGQFLRTNVNNEMIRVHMARPRVVDYGYDAVIRFMDQASDGFDRGYDFMNLSGNNFNISVPVAGQELSIASFEPIRTTKTIPLTTNYFGAIGEFELSFSEADVVLFNNRVYLRDNLLSTIHSINAETSYIYQVTSTDNLITNRFELVFSPDQVTGIHPVVSKLGLAIYPNPSLSSVGTTVAISGFETNKADLTITDAFGRMVYSTSVSLQANAITEFKLSESLASGIYSVKVAGGSKALTQKMIVK